MINEFINNPLNTVTLSRIMRRARSRGYTKIRNRENKYLGGCTKSNPPPPSYHSFVHGRAVIFSLRFTLDSTEDLTQNTQGYSETFVVILPICTVATFFN
jgi:hypothetical protein